MRPASWSSARWGEERREPLRSLKRRALRAAFSFVHFFWPNKRNGPRVQGRSHPQLCFCARPKATRLYGGMTAKPFGGLRQKTPNPPYILFPPHPQPSPARGEGDHKCVCPSAATNNLNACPRWLNLFFTSGGSSAEEQLCVGTKRIGS